ncbi:hypothetical protein RchiOBHm_Chr1g0378871 [Rosa chinensis]|uniref:Nucleotide-binding alpha-beta plait domain-containing protein n=1 Tax=Rosa chinensis TaxID=74649 RepID=A0A2P6SNE4_ROSCH|nr:hypothetical protein RchiOBHm_Chr1g0378871 [Rosa chinensis]
MYCRVDPAQSKIAFVMFKDAKALEIALLLSKLVESAVCAAPAESVSPNVEDKDGSPNNGRVYVNRAQDVMSSMFVKGSAIGQDAVNKAKAFDEKHRLRESASEKVTSFDKRVGLTKKLIVGLSVVNEKVKYVDQRLQVSNKTMAAIFAAERKLNDTGSTVKTSSTLVQWCF